MIGLRKVVNLKIYDLPESEVIVKKDGVEPKTFGYSYETKYYIGNGEFLKKRANSEKRNSLSSRKFNESHLVELIRSCVDSREDLEKSLNVEGNGFMYFSEQGNKIG